MTETPHVDKALVVIAAAIEAAGTDDLNAIMEILAHAIMVVSTEASTPRSVLQEVGETLLRAAASMPANLAKETSA